MNKVAKHGPIKLWGSYLSTIFSISLVLFVLGLLMLLGYYSYRYATDIKENIIYNVILSPSAESHEISTLNKMLNQKDEYPYIKKIKYISKEEAAENFTAELGDDFVDFLGYNPLFPSFEVNMKSDISAEQLQTNIQLFKESGDDEPVAVEQLEWENSRYVINEKTQEMETEVQGTFRQYPLRLACWWLQALCHRNYPLAFHCLPPRSQRHAPQGFYSCEQHLSHAHQI